MRLEPADSTEIVIYVLIFLPAIVTTFCLIIAWCVYQSSRRRQKKFIQKTPPVLINEEEDQLVNSLFYTPEKMQALISNNTYDETKTEPSSGGPLRPSRTREQQSNPSSPSIERGLANINTAMIVHAILDFIMAVLLFVWPEVIFVGLGYTIGDFTFARVIAAALFAIAFTSWKARTRSMNYIVCLIEFKIIWAGAVTIYVISDVIERAVSGLVIPWFLYVILALFSVGFSIWISSRWFIATYFPLAGSHRKFYDDTKFLIVNTTNNKSTKISGINKR